MTEKQENSLFKMAEFYSGQCHNCTHTLGVLI